MKRYLEVSEPTSCLNKAGWNEPLFVLRAKDDLTPSLIEFWINERVRTGKNQIDDPKIREARQLLEEIKDWKEKVQRLEKGESVQWK